MITFTSTMLYGVLDHPNVEHVKLIKIITRQFSKVPFARRTFQQSGTFVTKSVTFIL